MSKIFSEMVPHESGRKNFPAFIAGEVTCVIPVYQRNYDWKTANCQRLFDDIKNDKPHFIGTFVYQHKPTAGISTT